jgi:hypothetical protein
MALCQPLAGMAMRTEELVEPSTANLKNQRLPPRRPSRDHNAIATRSGCPDRYINPPKP